MILTFLPDSAAHENTIVLKSSLETAWEHEKVKSKPPEAIFSIALRLIAR
jgi:hypothetical protein